MAVRSFARLFSGLVVLATMAATAATLAQSPFAQPFRERSTAELKVALDRALAGQVDAEWIDREVLAALNAGDIGRADALARLAGRREIALNEATAEKLDRADAGRRGVAACLRCAWDAGYCASVAQVAACNLPGELTPLGDVNAIRRATVAALAGEPVDRIDLGLGLVGLAASSTVLVTAGSSAPVKAGASFLRVARRSGALTAPLAREVARLAVRAVRWDRLGDVARLRAAPGTLVDAGAAAGVARIAGDAGRLGSSASPETALAVLRYADNGPELSRVAHVTEAAGDDAPGIFAALGKSRVLRLTHRIADLALLAMGLVALVAAQIGSLALAGLRRLLLDLGRGRRQGPARRMA